MRPVGCSTFRDDPRPAVHVTNRNRERICRIVWRRRRLESEKQLHHLLDLMFLRPAESNDGALDLRRRVLHDGKAGFRRRQQRDPPRMAEFQRAAHVAGVEDILHRDTVGPVSVEQRGKIEVKGKGRMTTCFLTGRK